MCSRWLWRFLALPLFVAGLACSSRAAGVSASGFEVQSVTLNGKTVAIGGKSTARLGSFPENIVFGFGARTNAGPAPIRLQYRLEGFENEWRESDAEMALNVRFYNGAGDQVGQQIYSVHGESAGWHGSLRTSSLNHRRETLVAPAQASRVLVAISSAGPPQSVGIYVVADLVASKSSAAFGSAVILPSPFDNGVDQAGEEPPPGWVRNGTRPSMARIVKFGQEPQTKAFGLIDDDPSGHGEWHTALNSAPAVAPGDTLVVEWNEIYSIGPAGFQYAHYDVLPAGHYKFRVRSVDVMGVATGGETALEISVPPRFWKTLWFWGATAIAVTGLIAAASRYFVWRRLRWEMVRLKHQRALQQERLRIAHDIHDDLGARATQISLLSAMAQETASSPDRARADFDKISKLARELVSALYETVWAVNPENDHLEAQGNYLCQMVNQLCEGTSIRARFHVLGLPQDIRLSSQTRHNINMVVKEAVHNVVKHSAASQVTIRMTCANRILDLSIEDDGVGFEPERKVGGNGLNNMKQRLANLGGSCCIESTPARRTRVLIRLALHPLDRASEAMAIGDSEDY